MKKLVIVLMCLGLVACGSDDSGDAGAVAETCTKPVTSNWQAQEIDFNADLRDVQLNTRGFYDIVFDDGSGCRLAGEVRGSSCSGQIIIESAIHNGVGADPGCADLIETSNYSVTGSVMAACDVNDSTDCLTYR